MIDRDQRIQALREILSIAKEPMTGQELSERFGVTRQVVVHDIAILRAQGVDIAATPRGYQVTGLSHGTHRQILAVAHPPALTANELFTLVDFGIKVVDVQVEHPVYGELVGSLHVSSRRDVQLFLEQVEHHQASLLSTLTDGHHMHTVECRQPERLAEAIAELRRQGIQVLD